MVAKNLLSQTPPFPVEQAIKRLGANLRTARLRRNPTPERAEVQEALAGNLCRCTGYEGIFRALATGGREPEGEA